MNPHGLLGNWRAPPAPPLGPRSVHVWRIRLNVDSAAALWPLLSTDEQQRANRFHQAAHKWQFVMAHGMVRRIVGGYADLPPERLVFVNGPQGKPALIRPPGARAVEFNLSHSGDLALVAVSAGAPVGIDVERWQDKIEHLELATRFFSPAEQAALHALRETPENIVSGFFAAWSRKEAYLKATGVGITRGLDHFDVSLVPGAPARLLADAHDGTATERWSMTALSAAPGYSAALVSARPLDDVLLFDAS